KQTYNRISYINKMFLQSLSQLPLTALFTKESLAIRLVINADLQLNKCTKESLVLWIVYAKLRL
ncbi:MAG: hypothetical protein SPC84_00965, partial [Oscillospiraceae bacterium]|nr:hypothetical protein [Oscillospiraceae bacterium]